MKTIICILSAIILLSACGTVHNRDNEYLDAQSVSALKMPKGASDKGFKNEFPVPEQHQTNVTTISLKPPGLKQDESDAQTFFDTQKTKS